MNINEIAERAYNNAVRLGKIGDRLNLEKLNDLHGEYMEALKALNDGNHTEKGIFEYIEENEDKHGFDFIEVFKLNIKDTYQDELTDLLFVILTLMKDCSMDIDRHVTSKMKYNELRDDHK